MSTNFKRITAIIIGLVIVAVGYYYLTTGSQPSSDQGVTVATPEDLQNQIGKDLIATLETIKGIKLDRSVLDSNVFQSLQDFSVPISPQTVGRENPFAPTGQSAPKK